MLVRRKINDKVGQKVKPSQIPYRVFVHENAVGTTFWSIFQSNYGSKYCEKIPFSPLSFYYYLIVQCLLTNNVQFRLSQLFVSEINFKKLITF